MKTDLKGETFIITMSWVAYYFTYFADKKQSSFLLLMVATLFPLAALLKRNVKLFSAVSIVALATSVLQYFFVKFVGITGTDEYIVNMLISLMMVVAVSSVNGLIHLHELRVNAHSRKAISKLSKLYFSMCWQYALVLSVLLFTTVSFYTKCKVDLLDICMLNVIPTFMSGVLYIVYKLQSVIFVVTSNKIRQRLFIKSHAVGNTVDR